MKPEPCWEKIQNGSCPSPKFCASLKVSYCSPVTCGLEKFHTGGIYPAGPQQSHVHRSSVDRPNTGFQWQTRNRAHASMLSVIAGQPILTSMALQKRRDQRL